jgi:hypothetical protein
MCGAAGAAASIFCDSITHKKTVLGFLCGIGCYYAMSWFFQSKVAMGFGKIFDIVLQ